MSQDAPVQPQQAFEELSRITLADYTLTTVMDKVAELTRRTVPGADAVSVTLVDRGKASTAAYRGEQALQLDERQYERGYGPCLDCIDGGQAVHIKDMHAENRWPQFAADARRYGVGSSMSVPVPVQREVAAALNIYSTDTDAFDKHAEELAATFAAYAGVALANMHVYEAQQRVAQQLQTAMESRAVIEQAKGILMGARRCTSDAAFDLLVMLSQDANRKLREVAQTIVDDAVGGADEHR